MLSLVERKIKTEKIMLNYLNKETKQKKQKKQKQQQKPV